MLSCWSANRGCIRFVMLLDDEGEDTRKSKAETAYCRFVKSNDDSESSNAWVKWESASLESPVSNAMIPSPTQANE